MKKMFRSIILGASFLPLFAHAQLVSEGTIKVGKDEKKGFIAACKNSRAEIKIALEGKLKEANLDKHSKKKGFYTYKGVVWSVASANKIDLCYAIKGKKRRAKIYLVASKGYDNYITSGSDATAAGNISIFLQQIDAEADKNIEIKKIEDEIAKANEKLQADQAKAKKAEEDKKKKDAELQKLKEGS